LLCYWYASEIFPRHTCVVMCQRVQVSRVYVTLGRVWAGASRGAPARTLTCGRYGPLVCERTAPLCSVTKVTEHVSAAAAHVRAAAARVRSEPAMAPRCSPRHGRYNPRREPPQPRSGGGGSLTLVKRGAPTGRGTLVGLFIPHGLLPV
jgi:hypothetical protein